MSSAMLETGGLVAFLVCVLLVWALTGGYLLVLIRRSGCRRRPPTARPAGPRPRVAVVIPVLNESAWINDKLDNVSALDYPRELLDGVVVDGRSGDGTPEAVKIRIARGERWRLLETPHSCGKSCQLNLALAAVTADYVLVTDVDARLDPGCLTALIETMDADPAAGLVGAVVVPETPLAEERIHWAILNWIWWLEGECYAAPGLSGVCYLLRRSAFEPLDEKAEADDVHLALGMAARGRRVRICPDAFAYERRVPRTAREFLRFRARRGRRYAAEMGVVSSFRSAAVPPVFRRMRRVRAWHLRGLPVLLAVTGLLGLALSGTRHAPWPPLIALPAGLSLVPALTGARPFLGPGGASGAVYWGMGLLRYLALTAAALVGLAGAPARPKRDMGATR